LELELEGLDFDEFEETFLELLAVGLSNVDPAALKENKTYISLPLATKAFQVDQEYKSYLSWHEMLRWTLVPDLIQPLFASLRGVPRSTRTRDGNSFFSNALGVNN